MKKIKTKRNSKTIQEDTKPVTTDNSEPARVESIVETEKPEEAKGPEAKIADLEKSLEELKVELEAEQEKRLRALADWDNYRRRTQHEFEQIIKGAGERLIKQMLPVIDDFERLFDQDTSKVDNSTLLQGVELIYKKVWTALTAEGLEPTEALDKPFDAELHEAMAQIEDPSKPSFTVINEVEKGYRLGDKIIRHAKVIVSVVPETEKENTDE